MRVYFDTSALAKRYIKESGTAEVNEAMNKASQIVVSVITLPELISALMRNKINKKVTELQYEESKNELAKDMQDMGVCELNSGVISQAVGLIEKFSLRTLDALHLACSIQSQSELFVSSDQKQLNAARLLKINVRQV